MNKILSFFITLFIFIYPLTSIASSTKSIGEKEIQTISTELLILKCMIIIMNQI